MLTVLGFQLSARYIPGSNWNNIKATSQLAKKKRQDEIKYKIFMSFYWNFKKKFK